MNWKFIVEIIAVCIAIISVVVLYMKTWNTDIKNIEAKLKKLKEMKEEESDDA